MSPVVDETAGDLPVKDVGLMRGGLMATVTDASRTTKPWRKHHVVKTKDPQRLFRLPKEQLEDLCLQLQEDNCVLKQHTRTQEQRLRRMSARLMRLRQARPGSGGVRDRNMEDTIQELEARVAMLEGQRGVLQNKLSLAKQHIIDLGGRTHYKLSKGKSLEVEGGARRATHTAPPRYDPNHDDTRIEIERFTSNVAEEQQVRISELELTAQTLRDALRERDKEVEGTMREMRRQQADKHRTTIRENVDLIHLQKQLSEKSATLRVTQQKFSDLQTAYESQLEESQRSLKESQGALMEKVEELSGQLKQERQRSMSLEGRLTAASLSLQIVEKLQEQISDLKGERDILKNNYDTLLESTFSGSGKPAGQKNRREESDQRSQKGENMDRVEIRRLQELLKEDRNERQKLEQENERLRQEALNFEEHKRGEEEFSISRHKREQLEREILQYKEQVCILQDKLDSVSKEFDMSVEELSETLLQIKAFRLQQEGRKGLQFLQVDDKTDGDVVSQLTNAQALHAETVLELQKTRNLLLLEHRITKDLQEELYTVSQRLEQEREESRRRLEDKDKLLSKRALQINSLQAQLKDLVYNPKRHKRTIPVQYTWSGGHQEVVPSNEDDESFSQVRAGESLLEIHLKAATFTPGGLQTMSQFRTGLDGDEDIVSFCTYTLLDFEVHSTPLVSGTQPKYCFTSRFALSGQDLGQLGGLGAVVRVELHQAVGGVQFVTLGSGQISLMGAIEKRGERVTGRVKIFGSEGDMFGILDVWVRLFPPAEPLDTVSQKIQPSEIHAWQDVGQEELHDHGVGIPNELVIMLERCVGLSTNWPRIPPDSYLSYRFYDMPPHVSQIIPCSADPVFNDSTSYAVAVTSHVLHYLRSSSLWIYVFDDNDDQVPQAYLAKTPVPLQSLSTGREIRGDYVLRDAAGHPRGIVRVMMRWRYPFHPTADPAMGRQASGEERKVTERRRAEKRETPAKPVAKPRVKVVKQRSAQDVWSAQTLTPQPSPRKEGFTRRSPDHCKVKPRLTVEPRGTTASPSQSDKQSLASLSRRSSSDSSSPHIPTMDQLSSDGVQEEEEEEREERETGDSEASDSSESSDIIFPPMRKIRKGDKLRVEILSLSFEPSSHVALDESVQCVYVEYRLLGVPMETTETPVSLRKPTAGEEIHYNFTRVIYVDGSRSAPLRQYLYTMLEGSDPNQGRLKFTVVSEPTDADEECIDVGHAFLDLQELLLTGNDVTERQIDIVSVGEDKDVIGNLKVSLEAARVLSGIYQEFRKTKTEEDEDDDDHGEDDDDDDDNDDDYDDDDDDGESKDKSQSGKRAGHLNVCDSIDDSDF